MLLLRIVEHGVGQPAADADNAKRDDNEGYELEKIHRPCADSGQAADESCFVVPVAGCVARAVDIGHGGVSVLVQGVLQQPVQHHEG